MLQEKQNLVQPVGPGSVQPAGLDEASVTHFDRHGSGGGRGGFTSFFQKTGLA